MSSIRVDAYKTRTGGSTTANDVGLNIGGIGTQFKHIYV